jgi:F-type H+-transporting ATPase subunit b
MELLNPGTGLIFWQALIFLLLFFILAKFAWKPITESLRVREESIQKALDSAEKAKAEMAQLQAENKKLLEEARQERDQILKDAREIAAKMKDDAKEDATKQANRMISDARAAINTEKQAALTEVKAEVAGLVVNVTEKLLRRKLSDEKEQRQLIEEYIKDVNLN